MSGYKITDQNGLHFLTLTVVGWIDVFSRQIYRDIILESLKFCMKSKGLHLYTYVIMSNHIHIIVSVDNGFNLSDTLRDFKRHTSKTILKRIINNKRESRRLWMKQMFKFYAKDNKNNETYQFWRRKNRPIELISPKWINQKINYIHHNPVKAGIVMHPEEYLYSSAQNYLGKKGIIDVELIELGFDIGYVHT